MEVQVLYNTPHEIYLGTLIAFYFYLTGLSAGSFVISVISTIGGKTEYRPIGKIGAWLAPLLLILAPFNLIVDLEQPFRFWHLFYYLNFTSPITYGTFLLTLYPINCLIYLFFLLKGDEKLSKLFGIIGIPLAVAVHGYTGFILALGKGRALWSTALMPTLFLVSAMVSGIALVILVAACRYIWLNRRGAFPTAEKREGELNLIYGLGKFMGGLIICDLFLVANDILVLLTSHIEALEVAKLIMKGPFAPLFIGVEIILGGFVPIFIIYYPRWGRSLKGVMSASVLTLVGVLAMRIVVVIAGQYIPLH
jgi:tetrathionate reductase subunit C